MNGNTSYLHACLDVIWVNTHTHTCSLVNVYMLCDNRDKNNVNFEFSYAIDEIECIINAGSSTRLILCGDWNSDFM